MKLIKMLHIKFLDIPLRRKLLLVFIFIAILPVVFLGYYSYHTSNVELTRQMHINMSNDINQVNTNITKKLEFYSELTALLYLDLNLKNYLTLNYNNNSSLTAYRYIDRTFKNMTLLNNGISSITIYTDNFTLPSDGLYIKHIDNMLKNTAWFKKAMNSTGNILYDNTNVDDKGVYSFIIYRSLNFLSLNYPYGILTLNIKENEIYSLIDKENADKDVFIVDKSGIIISCKNKKLITKNISSVLHTDQILKESTGDINIKYNGSKTLAIFNSMNNGWKIVALIPYNKFLKNAKLASAKVLSVYFIVVFLAIFLIYVTSRGLTRRIEILVRQINKVGSENFNIHLPNMGNDEIGQLSNAFENMTSKLNELIEEVYKKEILKKQAEMDMLQAQINPHFLYNTLASISSLALKQKDESVNEMVSLLSKFYRISLNNGKNILSIEDEFKLTKYYLSIQQTRFRDLLHLHFNINKELYKYKTLKLILQPFVENAINHAIWNQDFGITIIINIYEKDGNICFEVIDDGIGICKETLSSIMNNVEFSTRGYGIRNVNERIKLYFGEEYGVKIFSRSGFGTKVEILIPMEEGL